MDFYYRWLLERHDKPCPSVGSKNGCLREAIRYNNNMAMLKEIEEQALSLSEADRATLAARLLDSLPAVLSEDDDGLAEALRRDAELEQSPSSAITWDELRRSVKP
jgi:putative addiction module component (TIGR02574 family)